MSDTKQAKDSGPGRGKLDASYSVEVTPGPPSLSEQDCIKQQRDLLKQYGPWEFQVHHDTERQATLQNLWNLGHMDLILEHCLILKEEGLL